MVRFFLLADSGIEYNERNERTRKIEQEKKRGRKRSVESQKAKRNVNEGSERNEGSKSAERAALYGMLIALGFIFSYIENLIPINLGVPGVKLGLANLVTVTGLYTIGAAGAAAVNLVRVILVGLTFGNLFSMVYSMAGAALSLLLMVLCKKKEWFSPVGVSIVGGVGHNVGQLAVAAAVVENAAVFSYLPLLLIAGTIAGTVIGILGGMVVTRIGKMITGRNSG